MVAIYMVVWKKMQKREEKGTPSSISTIGLTERHMCMYVCIGLEILYSKLPFYIIFSHGNLILYGQFYGTNEENSIFLSHFSNIAH